MTFETPPDHLNCQEVVGAGAFCMKFATLVKNIGRVDDGRLSDLSDVPDYAERPQHVNRDKMRPERQGTPKYED